jgi:hypothetical protein
MHLAHKTFRVFFPAMSTVTLWRLGLKVRLVARSEWLRLWPNIVVLPQDSHFAMVNNILSIFMSVSWCIHTRFSDKGRFYHNPHLITRNFVLINI